MCSFISEEHNCANYDTLILQQNERQETIVWQYSSDAFTF